MPILRRINGPPGSTGKKLVDLPSDGFEMALPLGVAPSSLAIDAHGLTVRLHTPCIEENKKWYSHRELHPDSVLRRRVVYLLTYANF